MEEPRVAQGKVEASLGVALSMKGKFMIANNNTQNNGKIEINGKTYQTVAYRLAEFRKQFPTASQWDIATECLHRDNETVVFKATIISPEGKAVASGHAEEKRDASFINRTSAMENAETSAIGRALAAAGFIGSEFASAEEVALAIQAQAQSGQASKAEAKPQPKAAATPPQPPASQAKPTQPAPAQPAAKPAASPVAKPAEPAQITTQGQAKPTSQARPAAPSQGATPPNEQMAEKWTRDNLATWLDTPLPVCQSARPYLAATGGEPRRQDRDKRQALPAQSLLTRAGKLGKLPGVGQDEGKSNTRGYRKPEQQAKPSQQIKRKLERLSAAPLAKKGAKTCTARKQPTRA